MKFTFLFSLVAAAFAWDHVRQQGTQVADNIRHQANSVYTITENKVSRLSKNVKSLFAKLCRKMPSMYKNEKKSEENQEFEPTSDQVNEFFKQLQQKLQELQSEKLSSKTPDLAEEKEKSKSESGDNKTHTPVREEL